MSVLSLEVHSSFMRFDRWSSEDAMAAVAVVIFQLRQRDAANEM